MSSFFWFKHSPRVSKLRLLLERLEDRALPATSLFSVASATQGGIPNVIVRDGAGTQIANFFAFPSTATSTEAPAVNLAVGDVNGDGTPDIIAARGSSTVAGVVSGSSEIKVIDGTKLNMVDANHVIEGSALLADFLAYDPGFLGGAFVAFGLSAGKPQIITGAGLGGGPHVKVIDATKLNEMQTNGEIADSALIAQFYAYDPRFGGGVRVAAGDLNGDGVLDIVTAAGPYGGPHVKAIDGTKMQDLQNDSQPAPASLLGQFYAYDPTFPSGVYVAVTFNGTHPVIVTGKGFAAQSGGPLVVGPEVRVVDATRLTVLDSNSEPTDSGLITDFFAYRPEQSPFGVTVAAADINGDGVGDIITGGDTTGGVPQVKVIDGTKLAELDMVGAIQDTALLDSFFFQAQLQHFSVLVGGG
jgi:hypothetical protein